MISDFYCADLVLRHQPDYLLVDVSTPCHAVDSKHSHGGRHHHQNSFPLDQQGRFIDASNGAGCFPDSALPYAMAPIESSKWQLGAELFGIPGYAYSHVSSFNGRADAPHYSYQGLSEAWLAYEDIPASQPPPLPSRLVPCS